MFMFRWGLLDVVNVKVVSTFTVKAVGDKMDPWRWMCTFWEEFFLMEKSDLSVCVQMYCERASSLSISVMSCYEKEQ